MSWLTKARPGLRVEFDGLTGLVPKRSTEEADKGTLPEEFLVVLPDVSHLNRADPREPGFPQPVPSHVAAVVVPGACVSSANRNPDLVFARRAGGPLQYVYQFQNELLTIEYPNKEGLTAEWSDAGEKPAPNQVATTADLHWVPSLAKLGVKGAGVFDRTLVNGDDTPSLANRKLAGVVRIDSGNLRSDGVVDLAKGGARVYDFRVPGSAKPTHKQAIVRALVWTAATEDSITFRWSRQGGKTSEVVLDPLSGREQIRIVNRELEAVAGVGEAQSANAAVDFDFAVLYWLCRGWPDFAKHGLVVPHPRLIDSVGGGGPETCKPGGYLAW